MLASHLVISGRCTLTALGASNGSHPSPDMLAEGVQPMALCERLVVADQNGLAIVGIDGDCVVDRP